MKGLAALGALASGGVQGYAMGLDMANRRKQQGWQDELQTRQRKQWEQQDAITADMNAANDAARAVMAQHQRAYESGKPQAILDGQPLQQSTPFKPSNEQIMEAAKARTDTLFAKGRTDQAVQHWVQDESIRRGLRQQAVEKGMLAFRTSGDPTELLTGVYKHLDDGWDIASVTPAQGADGKPVWEVKRSNAAGQTKTNTLGPDQIEGLVQFSLDPKASAEYALKTKLEQYKAGEELKQIRERGAETRTSKEFEHALDLKRDKVKFGYSLGEVAARGGEERKSATHKDGLERTRPYTLGDGAQRAVDERQPDGTLKPKVIAENRKDPAGSKVTTQSQINAMVINNFGVLDPGSGRQVGTAKTQTLSAAAERLMADNPGLGANEAIQQAAKDLGVNLVPKK